MFKYFVISVSSGMSDDRLWIKRMEIEGDHDLCWEIERAHCFSSFYVASRFAALLNYPYVFVEGIIIND